jgi:Cu2+-exporting ATPase
MPAVTDRKKLCVHCGTPFHASKHQPDFCCAGCQFVHDLIVKSGLGQFYDLQDGALPPAPGTVFQPRDYAWLTTLAAQTPGPLVLDLQGLSCVGCVWLIERLFHRRAGALTLRVEATLGRLTLQTAPEFDHAAFARELQSFGYLVGPPTADGKPASRALLMRLGLCAALALNAMLFSVPGYFGMRPDAQFAALFANLALICGTLSFAIGGSYFIRRAWQSLRASVLHIDLPITLGLSAAWVGSLIAWRAGSTNFVYFDFVSMFTFLMLTGRWLQQKAVEANRARLLAAAPDLLRPDLGEHYTLARGATVPVRSLLLSPAASVSLEWINGEPEAQAVRAGQMLAAGAINLTAGPITLEAREPWRESFLARVVEQTRRIPRDTRIERFLRTYLAVVLALGAGAFCGWYFATGDLLRALQVLTSVLVVSCPCAAGVALPLADDLAAARVQRVGVFLRESSLWARLRRVKQIVFDKTGTLTLQGATLENPGALEVLSEDERRVLLALVRENLHPIASALREALMARGTLPMALDHAPVEHIGLGLEAEHAGHCWSLGRAAWIGAGRGDSVFARDGEPLAGFYFVESLRADVAAALDDFRSRDLRLAILSGDRPEKVTRLAQSLALPPEQALGALTPEEKAAWLRVHDATHTLMIGDGANDSLAFREALCTGTPAIDRGLLEHQADFYFLGRSLGGLRVLLATAAARANAGRLVLTFAIAYNIVAVALSAAGQMSPLAAAVLMPLSSLATIGLVLVALRRLD